MWGFGTREGKTYFLKEYLSPVFPPETLSQKIKNRRERQCLRFQQDKIDLFTKLNFSSDGNLLKIHEFFRFESKYYIAAEAIHALSIDPFRDTTDEQKQLIMLTLAHAMKMFHSVGLVHGDVKPDNLLYRLSEGGNPIPILIDVDNCFYKGKPPKNGDEVQADQMYMAPETFRFIRGEDVNLSEKIDVFALGIIFYEILTGTLPGMDTEKYTYPFAAVMDGQELDVRAAGDPRLANVIGRMLALRPEDRAGMEDVYGSLMDIFGTSGLKRVSGRSISSGMEYGLRAGGEL